MGVREYRLEEPLLSNSAVTCALEVSASYHLSQIYHRSKRVRESRHEEPPLDNLAVTSHLEESAPYHYQFNDLEAEITQVRRDPRMQAGGTSSRQSGGHLSPEGECFAQCDESHEQCEQVQGQRLASLSPSNGFESCEGSPMTRP